MVNTVIIRCYNRLHELAAKEIVDSTTRSGATRKANRILKDSFFEVTKKTTVGNYQYWDCYDIADIDLGRIQ